MSEKKITKTELKSKSLIISKREEATKFWQDFKDFAFKGDVLDLAIGVIIGGAFNKIVQSLTSDIIMPIFGRILGNMAFSDLYLNLGTESYNTLSEAVAAGAPVIKYGAFITNVLDFLIIAMSLYVAIRFVLGKRKEEAAE